jgi:hypothetical protein
MNVCELWNKMSVGQTASSKNEPYKIYKSEYGLYWNEEDGGLIQLNVNVLCDDEWEIDISWVDFWTAYQSAKKEGWSILSEFRSTPSVLQNGHGFEQYEIDGRWQILNQ